MENFRHYYDERAREYDEIYSGKGLVNIDSEFYLEDVNNIGKIIKKIGNGSLIDIGCGTGFWLPYYARNCSTITLLDQSRKMLLECRKRVVKLKIENKCHIITADFFAKRIKKAIYDCVLIGFFVSHLSFKQEPHFFQKLRLILKPRASIMVVDSAWTRPRMKNRKKEGQQARILNDGRKFTIYKRYFNQRDIEKIFKRYGFKLNYFYLGNVWLAAIGEKK